MYIFRIFLLLLFLSTLTRAAQDPRYDEVTWLCTHNAMSSSDDGWKFTNQTHTITKQMEQGVNALMLDVWKQDGELVLRHGPKVARYLGYKKLNIELANIHTFLTKHPDRIITLILESYAPANEVATAIKQAKLAQFCHFQNPKKPWPKLSTMRNSGKRLVVLSDRVEKNTKAPDWYMHVWTHAWETNWQAKSKDELLNAKPRRGKRKNKLFILNHFITKGLPNKANAQKANTELFLSKRIESTRKIYNRKPTFLVLDFYEIGAGTKIVKRLNGQEK